MIYSKHTHNVVLISSLFFVSFMSATGCGKSVSGPSANTLPTIASTGTITSTATISATATETCTTTATPTEIPTKCVAFGTENNDTGFTTAANDRTFFQKHTLLLAATVYRVWLRVWNPGNFKVAIYADSSGCPGTRLVVNSSFETLGAGWKSIEIAGTYLAAGDYWLAVYCNTSGDIGGYNSGTGISYQNGIGLPADMSGVCPSGGAFSGVSLSMWASCNP